MYIMYWKNQEDGGQRIEAKLVNPEFVYNLPQIYSLIETGTQVVLSKDIGSAMDFFNCDHEDAELMVDIVSEGEENE